MRAGLGLRIPAMTSNSVVLPAPLGPMMPRTSPAAAANSLDPARRCLRNGPSPLAGETGFASHLLLPLLPMPTSAGALRGRSCEGATSFRQGLRREVLAHLRLTVNCCMVTAVTPSTTRQGRTTATTGRPAFGNTWPDPVRHLLMPIGPPATGEFVQRVQSVIRPRRPRCSPLAVSATSAPLRELQLRHQRLPRPTGASTSGATSSEQCSGVPSGLTKASGAVRGFDGTTVKVAGFGIKAELGGAEWGARARVERFNATNEIPGIKLDFTEFADDADDPATSLSIARRLVTSDQVFGVVGDVSATNPAAYLVQQQGAVLRRRPRFFLLQPEPEHLALGLQRPRLPDPAEPVTRLRHRPARSPVRHEEARSSKSHRRRLLQRHGFRVSPRRNLRSRPTKAPASTWFPATFCSPRTPSRTTPLTSSSC